MMRCIKLFRKNGGCQGDLKTVKIFLFVSNHIFYISSFLDLYQSRNLSTCIYHPSPINASLLTRIKGHNFLSSIGHAINGEIWLYPEETLWLMERGVMRVEFAGVPISLQQAYALMLDNSDDGVSLEKYQVCFFGGGEEYSIFIYDLFGCGLGIRV